LPKNACFDFIDIFDPLEFCFVLLIEISRNDFSKIKNDDLLLKIKAYHLYQERWKNLGYLCSQLYFKNNKMLLYYIIFLTVDFTGLVFIIHIY
jgi:hypothetical protein